MPIPKDKDKRIRLRVAAEAARIMVESGISDYYIAKQKAAARFGSPNSKNLPRNTEIEQALHEHLRLFKSKTQPAHLKTLREIAVQLMQLLSSFNPHLVGSVLTGTAGQHSRITLHVFTDTTEDIGIVLMTKNIPYSIAEKCINRAKGNTARYPVYAFMAGESAIEIMVFPVDGIRQAPLSPVDGRPMRRATLATVQSLIDAEKRGKGTDKS